MTKNFSKIISPALMSILGLCLLVSCKNDDPKTPDGPVSSEINVTIPANMDVVKNSDITFQQKGGSITTSDNILLENGGQSTPCAVKEATEDHFTIPAPKNLKDGTYKISLLRGGKHTELGQTKITVVNRKINIPEGATIYGIVETEDGTPVPGVVISDGVDCCVTNSEGIYGMESNKQEGLVFMSVPSGYEPLTDGVMPKIYQRTSLTAALPENISFTLKKVENQDNFKVLFLGDMHLANRSQDIAQYKRFCRDVNTYKGSHSSEHIYGITLGDMTWDAFWKNGYELSSYRKTINENINDMVVYQCIGNHDHDPNNRTSYGAGINPLITYISPAWYSFNIGQVHFVVMDNIDISPKTSTDNTPYKQNYYGPQMAWLEQDLSYVPAGAPIYIITHGSQWYVDSKVANNYVIRSETKTQVQKMIEMTAGHELHFVSGHLHQQHTILPTDGAMKGYSHPVYEHNVPAVCGDWWYSGYYTPGVPICTDGTPYGYAIFDITGKTSKWSYKGTDVDERILFRTYDLNNVDFSGTTWKNLTNADALKAFNDRYINAYTKGKHTNEVLINVWNWNTDSKITVKTASGTELATTQVYYYDPLSIAALTIPYWDRGGVNSTPGTYTTQRFHFFLVKCPDATTDLNITVTDKFGNTYSETMERPRRFSTDEYKIY